MAEATPVCQVCGDAGFQNFLLSCDVCQRATHQKRGMLMDDDDTQGAAAVVQPLELHGSTRDHAMQTQVVTVAVTEEDHLLESTMAPDSKKEPHNQQFLAYSQPIDVPVWSGVLKTKNNKVQVKLAAHLSNKACKIVCDLSGSMQPVVEAIKLSRLEAWPESWKSSEPSDDNIALYFFSPNMRANEELDSLVEDIIESESALKAVVSFAELLIFPSTVLPEEYHVCQGKHYLWGVLKRRQEDESAAEKSKGDGSASNAEEVEMIQQDDHLVEEVEEDAETCHIEEQDVEEPDVDPAEKSDVVTVEEGDGSASAAEEEEMIQQDDHVVEEEEVEDDETCHVDEQDMDEEDEEEEAMEAADMGPCRHGSPAIPNLNSPADEHLVEEEVEDGETCLVEEHDVEEAMEAADTRQGLSSLAIPNLNSPADEPSCDSAHVSKPAKAPIELQQLIQQIDEIATPGSGFVSMDHDADDEDDDDPCDACLDLFPVVRWTEAPRTLQLIQQIEEISATGYDFFSMVDHDEDDDRCEACLQLFPVACSTKQLFPVVKQHPGWNDPLTGAAKDVDLELRL